MTSTVHPPLRFGRHTMMDEIEKYKVLYAENIFLWKYITVCVIVVVYDDVVCSVALHCDAWYRSGNTIIIFVVV